jgi:hypothetical protein
MATDYGIDIKALSDLPDPEQLTSGDENVAYAQARRLLTPDGAHEDIGDDSPYESIDLRAYLGRRMSAADRADLSASVPRILSGDPRVRRATATVTTAGSSLTVESRSIGDEGPFGLVLSVDSVDSAALKVT